MRTKEVYGLLYAYRCLYFVAGNYLIDSHDLIVHHVSTLFDIITLKYIFLINDRKYI